MRTFNSPGGASMVIMFEVLPEIRRGAETGQDDGSMPRGLCALSDAPNWLAAESVHVSRAARSLSMAGAISMPPSIANKTRSAKLVASPSGFFERAHGQAMGVRAQIRAAQVRKINNSTIR